MFTHTHTFTHACTPVGGSVLLYTKLPGVGEYLSFLTFPAYGPAGAERAHQCHFMSTRSLGVGSLLMHVYDSDALTLLTSGTAVYPHGRFWGIECISDTSVFKPR